MCACVHAFMHSFIHSFIHAFIHSFIHLSIRPSIHPHITGCCVTLCKTSAVPAVREQVSYVGATNQIAASLPLSLLHAHRSILQPHTSLLALARVRVRRPSEHTPPHLTSPHLTSPHLTSPHLSCLAWLAPKLDHQTNQIAGPEQCMW